MTTSSIVSSASIERIIAQRNLLSILLGSFRGWSPPPWGWTTSADSPPNGVSTISAARRRALHLRHVHPRRADQSRAAHRQIHQGNPAGDPAAQHLDDHAGSDADLFRLLL